MRQDTFMFLLRSWVVGGAGNVRKNCSLTPISLVLRLVLLAGAIVQIAYSPSSSGVTQNSAFQKEERVDYWINGFSPDNRHLSLDVCSKSDCRAVLLEWQSGKFSRVDSSDSDEVLSSGRFSPSGKYMVFTVKRKSEGEYTSQFGLYNLEKRTLRIITNTSSYKNFASFSPDEKRLIYMQADRERASGKTRHAGWDVYELFIDSARQHRLTNYGFHLAVNPAYFPDGKTFIFSGEGPSRFSSKTGQNAIDAYRSAYQRNTVFIHSPEATELRPAFTNGNHSNGASISRNGRRIAYIAITNDLDSLKGGRFNYDIFMLEDGQHRRLTKLGTFLYGMELSADGSLIAFVSDPTRKHVRQLFVMSVANGKPTRIELRLDQYLNGKH